MDPENVEANNPDPKAIEAKASEAKNAQEKIAEENTVARVSGSKISEGAFRRRNRRELLKLTPLIVLGAFAIPSFQSSLLKKGLGFSDWASARLFRSGHLAPTFADSALTPFEKFPINGYDVDDPGVIFENWNLTVSGTVKTPGDYTLAQIQAPIGFLRIVAAERDDSPQTERVAQGFGDAFANPVHAGGSSRRLGRSVGKG